MFSMFGNMRVALRTWISAHPFTSVGGAFVVGYFAQLVVPAIIEKVVSML
jgi:hypothetical protein